MTITSMTFKKSFIKTVAAFGALSLIAGCAKPMSSGGDMNASLGDGDKNEPCCVKPPVNNPPSIDPVEGTISEGLYDGETVFHIDPVEKMLTLKLPILGLALMPGFLAQAPVPGIPGAWVELLPITDGNAGLELHLPLEFLISQIDKRDGSKLPSGDPLPVVPGGELPAFAVAMHPSPDVEVLVYVGPESVAILYWSPFDPFVSLKLPIYMEGEPHPVGWFHAIPHKRVNFEVTYPRGGFLLGVSLPPALRRQIIDLF
jgi:hypothetical protein